MEYETQRKSSGVAAGTTVVNVTDVNSDIIATITVTVA